LNILKPQEIFLKNLTEASFIDEISKNAEKDVFSKISFTDETVANVKLFDITFEYCKFTNINMEQGKLEKTTFSDVIFTNCNFSNTNQILLGVNLIIAKLLVLILLMLDFIMLE